MNFLKEHSRGSKFFLLFPRSSCRGRRKLNRMHSALSRAVTHSRWHSPLLPSSMGIGVYIFYNGQILCSAVHADKLGRENEWVALDETELPSMRCPHANEHDNRRKVMSDRMAMVCHKCNHVGYAGYETMTTKRNVPSENKNNDRFSAFDHRMPK